MRLLPLTTLCIASLLLAACASSPPQGNGVATLAIIGATVVQPGKRRGARGNAGCDRVDPRRSHRRRRH